MFHGRPWECCHISPKGGGKEQKEQSESHLMKQVYSKQKLPLVVSRPNGSHSRFGHYFCSNIYRRTPRGPRGVKKFTKICYKTLRIGSLGLSYFPFIFLCVSERVEVTLILLFISYLGGAV